MPKMKPVSALIGGSGLWCAAILFAPLMQWPALYLPFETICHQDPSRSWHLAGEPLAVCIRCTSIYFGFFAALLANVRPNTNWIRAAVALTLLEFIGARLVLDSEVLRSMTGLLLGGAAAPFVRIGIEQMFEGIEGVVRGRV